MNQGKELEENENHFFAKKNLKYFGTIADRADRLMGRTSHLLEYAGQVRDAYQEQVAAQQNQNMPELENGYPAVILLSIAVVVLCIIIFKRKKIF